MNKLRIKIFSKVKTEKKKFVYLLYYENMIVICINIFQAISHNEKGIKNNVNKK